MATTILLSRIALRNAVRTQPSMRSFQSSARRLEAAAPIPPRKPVGAFRGGLLGFALGCSLTGFGIYYYFLKEYMASNALLSEDIFALQVAIQRVGEKLTAMEEKVETIDKKKKK